MDLHGIVVFSVPKTHKDLIQPCVLCELQEGYKMGGGGGGRNGDFLLMLLGGLGEANHIWMESKTPQSCFKVSGQWHTFHAAEL